MDKRTLLAIVISMGIILIWMKVFPPVSPPPPTPQTAPAPAAGTGQAAAPAAAPGSTPTPGTAQAPAGAKAAAGPEEKVTLVGQGARYELSSWGGVLRKVFLTETRFRGDKNDPQTGLEMTGITRPELGSLALSATGGDFSVPEGSWTVSRPGDNAVVFRGENDKVAVEKRYRLDGDYHLGLEVVIENKTDAALGGSLAMRVFGRQDPAKAEGGFFSGQGDLASLVCFVADEVQRINVMEAAKEPFDHAGAIKWVAADTKYFAVAVVPHPVGAGDRKCAAHAIDGEHGEAVLTLPKRTIAARGKDTLTFSVYAGPKYSEAMKKVEPAGQDAQLEEVVDVMFAVLSRPLLFMMKLFHGWVGNWGLAIIMLTIFVKILTFYPTQRAMMSGKRMQRLAPKMQELRKKYENDRARLGAETMNLYKKEGVSPLGGCLPSLITMPIWMALFSTLSYSVELYKAPFLGYIQDLSARDPYFITPLIMGAVMFLQMKMAPAGADPAQQKMMTYMMPIMFTAFTLFLAAGLAIYTLTNSIFSILQQIYVNRLDRKLAAEGK